MDCSRVQRLASISFAYGGSQDGRSATFHPQHLLAIGDSDKEALRNGMEQLADFAEATDTSLERPTIAGALRSVCDDYPNVIEIYFRVRKLMHENNDCFREFYFTIFEMIHTDNGPSIKCVARY